MKKKYVAPDLYFESFTLSQSIAAGCNENGISITQSYVAMGLFSKNVPSNNQGITSCTDDYDAWVEQGIIEEYCYWQGSFNLFLS
ncbi:MAG: hypothetical protein LUJ09_05605 [Firmicutes bacterium]|nr:hypothetical protein [Bacillota bacterium]